MCEVTWCLLAISRWIQMCLRNKKSLWSLTSRTRAPHPWKRFALFLFLMVMVLAVVMITVDRLRHGHGHGPGHHGHHHPWKQCSLFILILILVMALVMITVLLWCFDVPTETESFLQCEITYLSSVGSISWKYLTPKRPHDAKTEPFFSRWQNYKKGFVFK